MKRFADETIRAQAGDVVLDIGCGPAALLPFLHGATYIGIDHNKAYIEQAKRAYNRGTFICADIRGLANYALPQINIAVAVGTLHHLDDATAVTLLASTARALAPGGRFISVDPCIHDDQSMIQRFVANHDRGQHVRPFAGYGALCEGVFSRYEARFERRYLPWPQSICIVEAGNT
jgi:SAM-dependent methyltransferase